MIPNDLNYATPLKENLCWQAHNIFREHAGYLCSSLKNNNLIVQLAPANPKKFRGHKIRQAISHPPPWYSDLYHSLSIKREGSYKSLERIIANKDEPYDSVRHRYWYDLVYREVIHNQLLHGFESIHGKVPPLNQLTKIESVVEGNQNNQLQPEVVPF